MLARVLVDVELPNRADLLEVRLGQRPPRSSPCAWPTTSRPTSRSCSPRSCTTPWSPPTSTARRRTSLAAQAIATWPGTSSTPSSTGSAPSSPWPGAATTRRSPSLWNTVAHAPAPAGTGLRRRRPAPGRAHRRRRRPGGVEELVGATADTVATTAYVRTAGEPRPSRSAGGGAGRRGRRDRCRRRRTRRVPRRLDHRVRRDRGAARAGRVRRRRRRGAGAGGGRTVVGPVGELRDGCARPRPRRPRARPGPTPSSVTTTRPASGSWPLPPATRASARPPGWPCRPRTRAGSSPRRGGPTTPTPVPWPPPGPAKPRPGTASPTLVAQLDAPEVRPRAPRQVGAKRAPSRRQVGGRTASSSPPTTPTPGRPPRPPPTPPRPDLTRYRLIHKALRTTDDRLVAALAATPPTDLDRARAIERWFADYVGELHPPPRSSRTRSSSPPSPTGCRPPRPSWRCRSTSTTTAPTAARRSLGAALGPVDRRRPRRRRGACEALALAARAARLLPRRPPRPRGRRRAPAVRAPLQQGRVRRESDQAASKSLLSFAQMRFTVPWMVDALDVADAATLLAGALDPAEAAVAGDPPGLRPPAQRRRSALVAATARSTAA